MKSPTDEAHSTKPEPLRIALEQDRARRSPEYSLKAVRAGSAEFLDIWDGVQDYDSVVFKPQKWLGAQFNCDQFDVIMVNDVAKEPAKKFKVID